MDQYIHEELINNFATRKEPDAVKAHKLSRVGYVRDTGNDSGWFYEVCFEDAVSVRVAQLMADPYVKKISINRDYGRKEG